MIDPNHLADILRTETDRGPSSDPMTYANNAALRAVARAVANGLPDADRQIFLQKSGALGGGMLA